MWYLILLLFLAAGLIFGFNSCWFNPDGAKTAIFNPNDSIKGYTRAQLEERLIVISKTAVPENLSPGAMCYEMAAPPKRIEYVCPVCNEKTLYTTSYVWFIMENIPMARAYSKGIKGINFRLDESQFCKKCSPKVISPVLCIITKFKDEANEFKFCGVNSQDVKLIDEFVSGQYLHKTENDAEVPLKDHIDRLKKLLNIK